jgi:D-sedoheptulose 7-phosphate isomerase
MSSNAVPKKSVNSTESYFLDHIARSSNAMLCLAEQKTEITAIIDVLVDKISKGGTLLTCGNGGSACQAMHLEEELVARYGRERPGIRAQHLCDGGIITCWANDYNFETAFERQVQTFMTEKDALVVLSTSGNSKNILRALAAAKKLGGTTIGLLGKDGGKARELCDFAFVVDDKVTAHIQEAHLALIHIICDQLEVRLYPECV